MKLIRRIIKEMRDRDLPVSDNIEDRRPGPQADIRSRRAGALNNQIADLQGETPPPPLPPPVESDSPKPEGQGGVGSDGVASKREADYTARRERNAQGLDEKIIARLIMEARIKIIKARIRNGKIQRRKKVSNVAGYTMRNNKLTRMSPAERRKRKLGAKRGKIKRKAKLSRSLRKRKLSLQKRKRLNIR